MRNTFAGLAVGMILVLGSGCATVSGEPSRLEVLAKKTAQDLLVVGKEFARAGALEACLTITKNALDQLKEVSEYATLLPSPEAFCGTFFKAEEEKPEALPEVRL